MSQYQYKAVTEKNKVVKDYLEASSREDAYHLLKSQKVKVIFLKEVKARSRFSLSFHSISLIEKATLCRYLSTMIKAGLPLPEIINIILQDTKNKKFKKILTAIQHGLQKGQNLSTLFSRYPQVFDQVFVTLTKAGEESGTLEKSFGYLANQYMASYELNQKVKSTLAYPIVIVIAMIFEGILMLTFVLPRIGTALAKLNLKLPPVTRLLLKASTLFGTYHWLVLSLAGFLLVVTIFMFKTQKFRSTLMFFFAKLPFLKKFFEILDLAKFNRTLSTLLKSGVPITDSLAVSSQVLSQPRFKKSARVFQAEIQKGVSFSRALASSQSVFPTLMIQTVAAGEKTGSLDVVLLDLADFYEHEIEHSLKSLTGIIEPVLMLIIGIAVGAMVISIIAPIYSVVTTLQSQIAP